MFDAAFVQPVLDRKVGSTVSPQSTSDDLSRTRPKFSFAAVDTAVSLPDSLQISSQSVMPQTPSVLPPTPSTSPGSTVKAARSIGSSKGLCGADTFSKRAGAAGLAHEVVEGGAVSNFLIKEFARSQAGGGPKIGGANAAKKRLSSDRMSVPCQAQDQAELQHSPVGVGSTMVDLTNLWLWIRGKQDTLDLDILANSEDEDGENTLVARRTKLCACRIALRDRLFFALENNITCFWRSHHFHAAQKSGRGFSREDFRSQTVRFALEKFRHQVWEFVRSRREIRCLDAEVGRALVIRRLLKGVCHPSVTDPEAQESRIDRHQTFWKLYHRESGPAGGVGHAIRRRKCSDGKRTYPDNQSKGQGEIQGLSAAAAHASQRHRHHSGRQTARQASSDEDESKADRDRMMRRQRRDLRIARAEVRQKASKAFSDIVEDGWSTSSSSSAPAPRQRLVHKLPSLRNDKDSGPQTNARWRERLMTSPRDRKAPSSKHTTLPLITNSLAKSSSCPTLLQSTPCKVTDPIVFSTVRDRFGGGAGPRGRGSQEGPNASRSNVKTELSLFATPPETHAPEKLPSSGLCPMGHPLQNLGTLRDDGWNCSAAAEAEACMGGITDFYQSTGLVRFRCEACDYDLCEKCVWSQVQARSCNVPFVVPWRGPGRSETTAVFRDAAPERKGAKATKAYLRMCRAKGVIPTPVPFATGHSSTLDASGRTLVDDDLKAFVALIRKVHRLDAVDLDGNALLTDKSLVPLLRHLFGRPASDSCERLCLKGCTRASLGAIDEITSLLIDPQGLRRLLSLDLSGVAVPTACQLSFCRAIGQHSSLRDVRLAETGLGRLHPAARLCVEEILQCPNLELLNISWNCFTADVFEGLGIAVAAHTKISKLELSNCAGPRGLGDESPVSVFLEGLQRDNTLKKLDVSLNRIDHRGALVLEDSLDCHKQLKTLCISENPLGIAGMRSFLRLLSRDSAGLVHFECLACGGDNAGGPHALVFSATNPSGHYDLDLRLTYHRSILRLLYKTCERFELRHDRAFTIHEYALTEGKKGSAPVVTASYTHPRSKDCGGVWIVPFTGVLRLDFTIDEALHQLYGSDVHRMFETSSVWAQPKNHAEDFITKHFNFVRFSPGFRKVVPLLAQWRSLQGQANEQQLLLDALSRDFLMTYANVEQLCRTKTQIPDVLSSLLHCVVGGSPQRYLTMNLCVTLSQYLGVYAKVEDFLLFNMENPTGHYVLDLGNPASYSVAEVLLLLDRWEVTIAKQQVGRVDSSQNGNFSSIRNALHQGATIHDVSQWHLPSHDRLNMDYVTWRRPPDKAPVLSDEAWEIWINTIEWAKCAQHDKVAALRLVSDRVFVSALQLRKLLGCFEKDMHRGDALGMFFLRLTNIHNEKICRSRISDQDTWNRLVIRFGSMNLFPFFQSEQYYFELNLALYEDRLVCSTIVGLALRERIENMKRTLIYTRGDGTVDFLPAGIPMSWEKIDQLPREGSLKFTYSASPEDRNFKFRRQLAVSHGGWRVADLEEAEVLWWQMLNGVPETIMAFLDWIQNTFECPPSCFRAIDGPDGNGVVSRREFEEGVVRLGWGSANDATAVKFVFDYLDPSGEGEISTGEWDVLHQLWKELQMSMLEFLDFIDRKFDSDEDYKLEAAWEALDQDGSGSIDPNEWVDTVKAIGYFGPAVPIFNFIAKGDGSIEKNEWDETVGSMWKNRESRWGQLMGGQSGRQKR